MVKQHRLHHILDGTAEVPARTTIDTSGQSVSNPSFEKFESLDSALASWLLASVAPSILLELVGLESAAQIWAKINKLYSSKSDFKILLYKNRLSN